MDKEKIITFDDVWKDKYVEGHPTQEGAINVSEVLYDSLIDRFNQVSMHDPSQDIVDLYKHIPEINELDNRTTNM